MKSKTKRPHMKEVGTERCGHICPERMCTNMKGCLDWEKEGHSVRRHETSRKRHPQCAVECPRYSKLQRHSQLGKGKSRQTVESATPTCEGLEDETDVDPPSHFNTLDLAGPSNVAGPSQIFSVPPRVQRRKSVAFIQDLNKEIISNSPIYQFLQNIEIQSVISGVVVAHLPLTSNLINNKNILHGSVSATIIDWIGGLVIASTGNENRGVSVDIHVTYSGSAEEGDLLIIEGKSRKIGGNLIFISVEIRARKAGDEGSEEKIVVTGSHTKYIE